MTDLRSPLQRFKSWAQTPLGAALTSGILVAIVSAVISIWVQSDLKEQLAVARKQATAIESVAELETEPSLAAECHETRIQADVAPDPMLMVGPNYEHIRQVTIADWVDRLAAPAGVELGLYLRCTITNTGRIAIRHGAGEFSLARVGPKPGHPRPFNFTFGTILPNMSVHLAVVSLLSETVLLGIPEQLQCVTPTKEDAITCPVSKDPRGGNWLAASAPWVRKNFDLNDVVRVP